MQTADEDLFVDLWSTLLTLGNAHASTALLSLNRNVKLLNFKSSRMNIGLIPLLVIGMCWNSSFRLGVAGGVSSMSDVRRKRDDVFTLKNGS